MRNLFSGFRFASLMAIAIAVAIYPLATFAKVAASIWEFVKGDPADSAGRWALGANTLTNLIPELYSNLDVVSRELVGLIPSVTLDPSTSRAAVGQTVRTFVAPAASATDITPGATPPDEGDQTIGNGSLTITKARKVPIRWTGEEELSLAAGFGAQQIRAQQIQQAFRTLANEMEADLAALHVYASRAAGTAGTTPFATANDYTPATLARQILVDNGSGESDLQLVVNTSAGANIRGKQSAVDAAGTTSILRQGVLQDVGGMMLRESAQIVSFTKGTGAGATTNTAGYAVGAKAITLAAAGTGSILAGDVITFAGDTNQYVVTTGDASTADAGTITLAAPGLRKALAASAVAITVVASSARNMAFRRSAIVLATRMPALPAQGDSAIDRTTVTDPRSGMSFEISVYAQYRRIYWEVAAAWGVKAVKPEHMALLLG